jgi:tetratricopeptide (TPR) repeat protein
MLSGRAIVMTPTEPQPSAADTDTLDAGVARPSGSARVEPVARGTSLGRYVVIGVAGSGAMGVVYRAYDPELQREVALKLLRPTGSSHPERAGARLRREAQAMARVSHPNVLPVYDAGTFGGQVWIAMEFLATEVLAEWLAATPRPWREIVAMFSQAGRGLAAAHAVGLVHRDFKPHNVLVGRDGRARVMDFGLARAASGESDTPSAGDSPEDVALDADLTVAGSAVGTPRYMAPEQHHGLPVDGRADQFAFCVALFEALYRTRAFGGDSLAELAVRKHERRLGEIDGSLGVPAWVHRVLLRGLEPDPARRFATMDELLAALADDPTVRRRRLARWVSGALVLSIGIGGAATMLVGNRPCRDADRKLVGIWDDDRRAEIRAAMLATDVPYAEVAEARVRGLIDGYTQAWIEAHDGACAATKIYGEQSEELLDARIACLDGVRGELAATLDLLATADARAVERAVRAVGALRPVAECGPDEELLAIDRAPTDAASVESRRGIEESIARGAALIHAGKAADGLAVIEPAVEEARRLGYRPLIAQAIGALSDATSEVGDTPLARAQALEALGAALASNSRRVAIRLLVSLAYLDGYVLSNWKAGHEWVALGSALNSTMDDPIAELGLLNVEGIVYVVAGEFEIGEQLADRAVAIQRELDPEDLRLTRLLGNLGAVLASRGRYAKAQAYFVEALAKHEEMLGPDHPDTLSIATNLAVVEMRTGDFSTGLARVERVAEAQARLLGAEHGEVANTLNNLASAYRQDGQIDRAIAVHERVIALRKRIHGDVSLPVAQSESNLVNALLAAKRPTEARAHLDRALTIRRQLLAADHPEILAGHTAEAAVLRAEGDVAGALAVIDAAIAPLQARLGPLHAATIDARVSRASLLAALDRPGEAVAEYESLLQLVDGADVPDGILADVEFSLARLVDDPIHARRLALSARSRPTASGVSKRLAEEIDAWLATHP